MRRHRLRAFSLWPSAALRTGSRIVLFTALTAPLFLVAGVAFLLAGVRVININTILVWRLVVIGIVAAFLLEWRYAKRPTTYRDR
jgi:hypothetical protein